MAAIEALAALARLLKLYDDERRRLRAMTDCTSREGDYLKPVFGVGSVPPKLMLIGEAPGGEEAKQGLPFVGKAGKQLDELLRHASIDRREVYVTNAVKFRPIKIKPRSVSNRTPALIEIREGLPLLMREIELVRPAVIATLGNTPLRAMLMLSGEENTTVGEAHGRARPLRIGGAWCVLFPLYHPASVIYNRALTEVLRMDLTALGELIKTVGADMESAPTDAVMIR